MICLLFVPGVFRPTLCDDPPTACPTQSDQSRGVPWPCDMCMDQMTQDKSRNSAYT